MRIHSDWLRRPSVASAVIQSLSVLPTLSQRLFMVNLKHRFMHNELHKAPLFSHFAEVRQNIEYPELYRVDSIAGFPFVTR